MKMLWGRVQALGADAGAGPGEFAQGVEYRVMDLAERFFRTLKRPGRELWLLDEVVSHHRERMGRQRISPRVVEETLIAVSGLRAEIVRSCGRM